MTVGPAFEFAQPVLDSLGHHTYPIGTGGRQEGAFPRTLKDPPRNSYSIGSNGVRCRRVPSGRARARLLS